MQALEDKRVMLREPHDKQQSYESTASDLQITPQRLERSHQELRNYMLQPELLEYFHHRSESHVWAAVSALVDEGDSAFLAWLS